MFSYRIRFGEKRELWKKGKKLESEGAAIGDTVTKCNWQVLIKIMASRRESGKPGRET